MSTTIPCRAKDPSTCKYHGAELRANKALETGDIDAYMIAQAEMTAAIKTTPEIIDYFNNQRNPDAGAGPTFAISATERRTRNNIDRAWQSLPERINNHYRETDNFRYTVGGTPEDTKEEKWTSTRVIYQTTAEHLLGLAKRETRKGITTHFVNRRELETDLEDNKANDLYDIDGNVTDDPNLHTELATAHDFVRGQLLSHYQGGQINHVELYQLLRTLDNAYWEHPKF